MGKIEKPDIGVDTLYAIGNRDTKELHFYYEVDVHISDDKQLLLRILRNVFGTGYESEMVEATVEEMRRLILAQWNGGERYYGSFTPGRWGAHLSVTVESDTLGYAATSALEEYLTTLPPLGVGGP